MRSVVINRFGGPEVLELVDTERPEPGPGEILVRVHAAGLNPADWKIRAGHIAHIGEPPIILGLDVSGVVEQTGAGVTAFVAGDEVYASKRSKIGTYAQYVVVSESEAAHRPPGVSHVEAAALPTAGLTAWQALHDGAELKPGQRVLIHAASGGVGHLAVQIAKAADAHVIGTAGAGNHAFLRELGADELIDYRKQDFAEVLVEEAARVDVVVDAIGGDYGPRSLSVLRPGGILLSISGTGSDRRVTPDGAAALGLRYAEFGYRPSSADLDRIAELVASGALRVHIDRTFQLEDVAEAHRFIETGRVRGKAVLTVR